MGKGNSEPAEVSSPAPQQDGAAAAPQTRSPDAKAKFQVLYWQDIPSEIKAWDDFDEIKLSLPPRFAEQIDASAQRQGHIQSDAYMAHLRWSEAAERSGTPEEVASAVKQELESRFR